MNHADEGVPWSGARPAGELDAQGRLTLRRHGSRPRPLELTTAAVIPVRNEARTLGPVLRELERLNLDETVVVVNGSTDGSRDIAERMGARVLHFAEPLGHDVGRAVGARATDADLVLFLDADIVLAAEELSDFLDTAAEGYDLVLNGLTVLKSLNPRHPVNLAKGYLNLVLGRGDLGFASLTGIPHVVSRHAIREVDASRLAVPPLFQAMAILAGMGVATAGPVDVLSRNRVHQANAPVRTPDLQTLILGDHLEALAYIATVRGSRGGFADGRRRRDLLAPPSPEAKPPEPEGDRPRAILPSASENRRRPG